jgi:hypothetical protein
LFFLSGKGRASRAQDAEKEWRRKNMRKTSLVALVAALGVLAFAHPVNANDLRCSSFGGAIIGAVNHNIIVDTNCTVASTATVNGNLVEPDTTGWSITVQVGASIGGNIDEKGVGDVTVALGSQRQFDGGIKEEGPGLVNMSVESGGKFKGNIVEKGAGSVTLATSMTVPAAPLFGEFNDVIIEEDVGNVTLRVGMAAGSTAT